MQHDIWSGHTPPVSTGTAPELTSYLTDRAAPSPAVLILPGGGYVRHADHEGEPVARWLGSLGIAAFVLKYRVDPDRHPAPLLDGKRAMRFLRRHSAEFSIDPDRIGVLGFSAGGHLAATLCVDAPTPDPGLDEIDQLPSRPDLAVLCYAVTTLLGKGSGSLTHLLGEQPDPRLREELSAQLHVDEAMPPTFLWHTAEDTAVDVANSLQFAQHLSAASVPFELHVFPHGKHGLGLAAGEPQVAAWTGLCASWLDSMGWVAGPGASPTR